MTMKIEPIYKSDVLSVIDLIKEAFVESIAPTWSDDAIDVFITTDLSEAKMLTLITAGHICLKAVEGSVVLGVLIFSSSSKLAHLFVKPSEYKKGIARNLFSAAIRLVDENTEYISLTSTDFAVSAYEKIGFQKSASAFKFNGCVFQPMVYWLGNFRLAGKVELIS